MLGSMAEPMGSMHSGLGKPGAWAPERDKRENKGTKLCVCCLGAPGKNRIQKGKVGVWQGESKKNYPENKTDSIHVSEKHVLYAKWKFNQFQG